MPTYEYVCSSCANEWEEVHKISEPAVEECPKCHNKTARRQISGGRFILKGGGWYADLYSSVKPGSGKKDDAGKTSADAKSSGGDAKPASTESKSSSDGGGSSAGSKDSGGGASTTSSGSTSSTSSTPSKPSTPSSSAK